MNAYTSVRLHMWPHVDISMVTDICDFKNYIVHVVEIVVTL